MKADRPLWSGWVRFLGLCAAGGALGYFAGGAAAAHFGQDGTLDAMDRPEAALLVAIVYLLLGAIVGVGALSPRLGAKILNVEDADEVREQQTAFRLSSAGSILFGAALAVFTLGGAGGPVVPLTAAAVGLFLLVGGIVTSVLSLRFADELMSAMMRDAGAVAYYLVFAAVGGWLIAAQLGAVRLPAAAEALAVIWISPILASFWVVGRRGMLRPRT